MRVPAAAERAVWSLIRACIASGGHLRAVAEGTADVLRPPSPLEHGQPQRVFWGVDGPGLPPRPWRIEPEDVFDCIALGCKDLSARTCVTRQLVTEAQRTQQTSRGQGGDYPHCDTRRCAQGRGIREALDPSAGIAWKGAGAGGRYIPERPLSERNAQDAARARQESAGLLEEVRTLDVDPDPAELDEGGTDGA